MACGATLSLKRTLEFDNIHITPRQKRRRCDKLTTMTSAAAPTRLHQNSSPFTDVNPKYTTGMYILYQTSIKYIAITNIFK